MGLSGGAQVTQSTKKPTLGFGSGPKLRVVGLSPTSCGVCFRFSLSPYCCACSLSLSNKKRKEKKRKEKKRKEKKRSTVTSHIG